MKALELIVPTPTKCGERCNCLAYYFPDRGFILTQKAEEMARAKRFTDTELAAEYWRAQGDESIICEGYSWTEMCGGWQVSEFDATQRASTIRRFATLPSYDMEES